MKSYRVMYQIDDSNPLIKDCIYEKIIKARNENDCVNKLCRIYDKNIKIIKIVENT